MRTHGSATIWSSRNNALVMVVVAALIVVLCDAGHSKIASGGRGGNGWARHGHPGTEGPFRNLSHESPFPLPG